MRRQYNFSRQGASSAPRPLSAALAIDTGSPVVSVAIAVAGEVVAERVTEQRQSSERLLQLIDEVLLDAGLQLDQIHPLLGLRGPGSFTGLRVGLATLQGMRLALGARTATLPTFQVLASLAPETASRVTACVDALRGQWLTQDFSTGPPYASLGDPKLSNARDLAAGSSSHCIGFGVSDLRSQIEPDSKLVLVEPGPLASQALRILESCPPDPNPELLSRPLYLRAPAVSLPRSAPLP